MKKFLAVIGIAAAFATIGWGSTYDNRNDKDAGHLHDNDGRYQNDRDKGDKRADEKRQGDDENIKRAQGDANGRRDVHDQGPLQDDKRGSW